MGVTTEHAQEGEDPKKVREENQKRINIEKNIINGTTLCINENDEEQVKVLALALYELFWRIKPICVRTTVEPHLEIEDTTQITKLSAKRGSVILHVEQNVPLIRVQNEASDMLTGLGRWAQRRLTKRRKSFYFSLANADRADSYHLSFSGPAQTYYAESEIVTINPGGVLQAEKMTATCRCDQVDSRLYVKGGDGFHNAALSFSYEDTNHRSLQTICVSTAICLALVCFTAFKYVLSPSAPDSSSSELQVVAIFFSVMTFAGLMSVWESLSGQRSEEWVWVSASVTMASSLVGLADLIYLITRGEIQGTFVHQILWGSLMVVEFFIFLLVLCSLFYKVKLHSSFMSRVPLTRSIENGKKSEETKETVTADKKQTKKEKKKLDEAEMYYEDLIGNYWADGWLIPSWVALAKRSDL